MRQPRGLICPDERIRNQTGSFSEPTPNDRFHRNCTPPTLLILLFFNIASRHMIHSTVPCVTSSTCWHSFSHKEACRRGKYCVQASPSAKTTNVLNSTPTWNHISEISSVPPSLTYKCLANVSSGRVDDPQGFLPWNFWEN